MVTTELVINTVNMLTGRVQAQPEPLLPVAIAPNSEIVVEETIDEEADDGVPALIPHVEDDDVSDDDDEEEQQEVEVVQPQPTRRSARIA
jgi:hypothetical protein